MRLHSSWLLLSCLVSLTASRPHKLADRLVLALRRLDEHQLTRVEAELAAMVEPSDSWEEMVADAPVLPFSNETVKSLKDSGDILVGRDKEQRIKNIREQVLRFLGRKDNKNATQPSEQQARILQLINKIKIERLPSTDIELQSYFPTCDLPRNTDEEAWDKGLQMNLFFNLNFTSANQGSLSIQYAKLRLFKLPQGNTTMALTDCGPGQGDDAFGDKRHYVHFPAPSSVLPIEEKQIRVSVYWYTRGLRKSHRAVKRKLLDSQMISLYGESWTEYNVKAAVKAWKELGKNFGISVEVEDEDRVILQASKIFATLNCSKETNGGSDRLDNSTSAGRQLSPLYPVIELSTREFPESEIMRLGGGEHRLRHHHGLSTELPQINDTAVGGIRWEDPRDADER